MLSGDKRQAKRSFFCPNIHWPVPKQHSLRVVHRHTEQPRMPEVTTQLQLHVVLQDLKAIADLIETKVNPEEGETHLQEQSKKGKL
jgi:hypothetical protein